MVSPGPPAGLQAGPVNFDPRFAVDAFTAFEVDRFGNDVDGNAFNESIVWLTWFTPPTAKLSVLNYRPALIYTPLTDVVYRKAHGQTIGGVEVQQGQAPFYLSSSASFSGTATIELVDSRPHIRPLLITLTKPSPIQ